MKSFYSSKSVGSGSGSGPSTQESQIGVAVNALSEEIHQQLVVVSEVQSTDVRTETEQAQAQTQTEEAHTQEEEIVGTDLIREFDVNLHVIADPGCRIAIDRFHPDIRDEVKRAYLVKGPTQPRGHAFPKTTRRCFRAAWFDDYDWLEYSVSKDAAYCFYCFLFRREAEHEKFGHVVFSKTGYDTWKNAANRGFPDHCRAVNGCHNKARKCADDFRNQRTSVSRRFESNTIDAERRYEVRVTAALDIARFLIAQGHAFRGHDESATSLNKGNFLEMLDWYKKRNNEVRAAFDDYCPQNARMTSHHIQKDLTLSCAKEIIKVIKDEIGDNLFSVLIDESRDISIAEQMAVIVRLVHVSVSQYLCSHFLFIFIFNLVVPSAAGL